MVDLSSYAAPLLGLFGTLTVAALGLYQWRKQHGNPNREAVAEGRRKAAELIWFKLEEMNMELRSTSDSSKTDPSLLITELNTVYARNSLYLDDETQRLSRNYLDALLSVAKKMQAAEGSAAEEWSNTAAPRSIQGEPALIGMLQNLHDKRELAKKALLRATGA